MKNDVSFGKNDLRTDENEDRIAADDLIFPPTEVINAKNDLRIAKIVLRNDEIALELVVIGGEYAEIAPGNNKTKLSFDEIDLGNDKTKLSFNEIALGDDEIEGENTESKGKNVVPGSQRVARRGANLTLRLDRLGRILGHEGVTAPTFGSGAWAGRDGRTSE